MFKNLFTKKVDTAYIKSLEKERDLLKKVLEESKKESNYLKINNDDFFERLKSISIVLNESTDPLLLKQVELLKKSKNEELKEVTKNLLNSNRKLIEDIRLTLIKSTNV
jgi:hypothetical protein